MKPRGIAMDLGTSGIRGQAVDILSGEVISTAVTTRHPLPGGNVIDQINFTLKEGMEKANKILIKEINRVIAGLGIDINRVGRLAVCGNPFQLSLFQGSEFRDLAYSGIKKLESMGVAYIKREAQILSARDIAGLNLPFDCPVIIPPSVQREIGADALAMIIGTGMVEKEETSLATDYGTNAEMALFHRGRIFTGSTSAGSAIEGQHISHGMLALPGAIADLQKESDSPCYRPVVLNSRMLPVAGYRVNLTDGSFILNDQPLQDIKGITGTGVIAVISQAMENHLITLPRINTPDRKLYLTKDIFLSEEDIMEAGKSIGAIRTGHITLCHSAGISPEDISTMYMAGATGTYVDPIKAQKAGLIPPAVKTVYQVGNTSLAMARELVRNPDKQEERTRLAQRLKETYCMFSASDIFKKVYILEFSHWTEGMPMSLYRRLLKKYRLADLPPITGEPEIFRPEKGDLGDLGPKGLQMVPHALPQENKEYRTCGACRECKGNKEFCPFRRG